MAVYLPIRAVSRSQKIRIGQQQVTPDSTAYIDVSDQDMRRRLFHHSAIGAYVEVGPLTASNEKHRVVTGCTVTQGTTSADRSIRVLAGEIRLDDGTYVTVAQQDVSVELGDPDLDRIDLVVLDDEGVASVIEGEPAEEPEVPDHDEDEIPLAEVDVVSAAGAGGTREVQHVTVTATGGNFTITYDGETTANIAYNASPSTGAASVQARLEALSNIGTGNVSVTGGPGDSSGSSPYLIEFIGDLAEIDVEEVTATNVSLVHTNEVQRVTVDATGGTFTLTYSGQTTSALAFDISNTDLKTALEALSNIATDEVAVSGGPGAAGGGTPYTITFQNGLGSTNVAQMTSNAGSLTGGAGTAAVTTITAGVAPSIGVDTDTEGVPAGIANASLTDIRPRP